MNNKCLILLLFGSLLILGLSNCNQRSKLNPVANSIAITSAKEYRFKSGTVGIVADLPLNAANLGQPLPPKLNMVIEISRSIFDMWEVVGVDADGMQWQPAYFVNGMEPKNCEVYYLDGLEKQGQYTLHIFLQPKSNPDIQVLPENNLEISSALKITFYTPRDYPYR